MMLSFLVCLAIILQSGASTLGIYAMGSGDDLTVLDADVAKTGSTGTLLYYYIDSKTHQVKKHTNPLTVSHGGSSFLLSFKGGEQCKGEAMAGKAKENIRLECTHLYRGGQVFTQITSSDLRTWLRRIEQVAEHLREASS